MTKHFQKHLILRLKSVKTFDWILVGLGLAALLIFAVLFFRKSSYITAVVEVGQNSIYYDQWLSGSPFWNDTSGTKNWFAETFRKGQAEKDGLGKTKAIVLDVYSYDKTPTRKTIYLTVKLNVIYSRSSNTYTYKGVPVLVGSPIKLNLDRVAVSGLVTSVEGFPTSTERKNIVVEAQIREENQTFLETAGTKKFLADAINIGDEVKDNNGLTLIKIVDKKVLPATKTVTTSTGRVLETSDPSRKDVYLTLNIYAQKVGDRYFLLKDVPILIDQIIPINTQTVSVFPVVTKFISY